MARYLTTEHVNIKPRYITTNIQKVQTINWLPMVRINKVPWVLQGPFNVPHVERTLLRGAPLALPSSLCTLLEHDQLLLAFTAQHTNQLLP